MNLCTPARGSLAVLMVMGLVAASGTPAEALHGVTRIKNGSEPRDGMRTYLLEERWRAGGEDAALFFGLVPRVDSDRDGNVYVLDAQFGNGATFDEEDGAWEAPEVMCYEMVES